MRYRSELKKKIIRELEKGNVVLFDDIIWRKRQGEFLRQEGLGDKLIVPVELLDYYLSVDHLDIEDISILK